MSKITVITVCRNEVEHIRETLDSIVGQTYADKELIVVDGGSTDGTREVLEEYAQHFSWWCSEPDGGIYAAMNKAVVHATGDYVIFMNGGDRFHDSEVLSSMSGRLTEDIVEGLALRMDTGQVLHEHDSDIVRQLLRDGISHQSTFIRRELLLKYPYDTKYKIVADWKFWLVALLGEQCSYGYVKRAVADVDMTGLTYSSFRQNLEERDAVLAELCNDERLARIGGVLRAYNGLTHDALVQYATYLKGHSRWGYELVRKVAKRVVWLAGRSGERDR